MFKLANGPMSMMDGAHIGNTVCIIFYFETKE